MYADIPREDLLRVLRENRARHETVFNEAVDGWKKEALKLLRARERRIRAGSETDVYIRLPCPKNHRQDYDNAIRAVEMHVSEDGTFRLEGQELKSLLNDDWQWKREFLQASVPYASGTIAKVYATDYAELDHE